MCFVSFASLNCAFMCEGWNNPKEDDDSLALRNLSVELVAKIGKGVIRYGLANQARATDSEMKKRLLTSLRT